MAEGRSGWKFDLDIDDYLKAVGLAKSSLQSISKESKLDQVAGQFSSLISVVKAAAITIGTYKLFRSAIDEAAAYDTALNSLNVALAQSGSYSEKASKSFEDFASTIQQTTKYSDNQVLS